MSEISELFARDPLSFTKEAAEVKQIVAYYREKRTQFDLGNKAAGSTKTMKKEGEPKPKIKTLDLDDLLNN